MARSFGRRLHDLFLVDTWNIGVIEAPIGRVLLGDMPPVRWLPEVGTFRYLADPFAVSVDGRVHILAEDYRYAEHRADIVLLTLPEALEGAAPQPAFDLGVHMSYPYLIEHQGEVFCLPETYEANQAALYRATGGLKHWTKEAVLLPGLPAIDTTLFHYENRWWLFFTLQTEGGGSETLHAAFSDSLTGPYLPHPGNPLKRDSRSSRPAGTLVVIDGALYRPAQDCGDTYGGAIAVNRVTALTPTDFAEETIRFLRPDPAGPYPHGLHTICAAGDLTIIDGKRTYLHPLAPPMQILGRLRSKRRQTRLVPQFEST